MFIYYYSSCFLFFSYIKLSLYSWYFWKCYSISYCYKGWCWARISYNFFILSSYWGSNTFFTNYSYFRIFKGLSALNFCNSSSIFYFFFFYYSVYFDLYFRHKACFSSSFIYISFLACSVSFFYFYNSLFTFYSLWISYFSCLFFC